jgi:hypothetical protein
LAKTFLFAFVDGGKIRKNHCREGFAFRDPDNKILTVDGHFLCGSETGQASPYTLEELKRVYNTKTFDAWKNQILYYTEFEDDSDGDDEAEDEHIGKGKAAAIGEDNEMLDIFDGIGMTITPTKDSSAIEVAKRRREAQQKDVQLAYLQTENAALRETLEESRETMRRLLTRTVARQTQIQHQFNDENIEIAEMWQSLIVSAGDRFLDENSCLSEISTIYAAGQGKACEQRGNLTSLRSH